MTYPGRSGGSQDYICLHSELGVWATKGEKKTRTREKNNREEENSKFYSLEIHLRGNLRFECISGRKSV